MANLPLNELVVPGSQDVLELAPDLSAEVTALQGAVSTLNTDVSNIPNGTYPNLAAGSILTDKYDVDTTPYLYRAMPYVSKRLEDVIVGGSVVWNQLAKEINSNNWEANAASTVSFNDGVATVTASANYAAARHKSTYKITVTTGHKYFSAFDAISNAAITIQMYVQGTSGSNFSPNVTSGTQWIRYESIMSCATGATNVLQLRALTYPDGLIFQVKNPLFIDLTAMFGSTIADYVYTLEQDTAGAGVAWLKSRGFFTKPYYAYDTGTIKSVEATAHITRGVNAWDEEWEVGAYDNNTGAKIIVSTSIRSKNYIPVLPNTTYYGFYGKTGDGIHALFYDEDLNYIKIGAGAVNITNRTFITPENARFMTFRTFASGVTTTAYNNDICINISDPTINGKYFPYEAHTYDLGDVTLRGIPKLVNNELVYDGDIYEHDGSVTRKYRQTTLNGSENWLYDGSASGTLYKAFYVSSDDIKRKTDYRNEIINDKGYTVAIGFNFSKDTDIGKYVITAYSLNVGTNAGKNWLYIIVNVSENITTASELKTWLAQNPITVVYELAAPTTETTDTFEQYQVCETGGTEEYTTTNDVPVGHETKYFTDVIGNVENIPAPPTANGTYTLQVTVSASGNTYAWV